MLIQCPTCEKDLKATFDAPSARVRCPACRAIFVTVRPEQGAPAEAELVELGPSAPPVADPPASAPFDFGDDDSETECPAVIRNLTYHKTGYSARARAARMFHLSAGAVALKLLLRIGMVILSGMQPELKGIVCCVSSGVALVPFAVFLAAGIELRRGERRYMTITGIVFAFLTFAGVSFSCAALAWTPRPLE